MPKGIRIKKLLKTAILNLLTIKWWPSVSLNRKRHI